MPIVSSRRNSVKDKEVDFKPADSNAFYTTIEEATGQTIDVTAPERKVVRNKSFGGGGNKSDNSTTPKLEEVKEQITIDQNKTSAGLQLALERLRTGRPLTPANYLELKRSGIEAGAVSKKGPEVTEQIKEFARKQLESSTNVNDNVETKKDLGDYIKKFESYEDLQEVPDYSRKETISTIPTKRYTVKAEPYSVGLKDILRSVQKGSREIPKVIGEKAGKKAEQAIQFIEGKGYKSGKVLYTAETGEVNVPTKSTIIKDSYDPFKIKSQDISIKTLTPEQAGFVTKKAVTTGIGLGQYAIPYLGTTVLASDVLTGVESALSPGTTVKEKQAGAIQAALATGFIVGASALKVKNYLGEPIIKPLPKETPKISAVDISQPFIKDGKQATYTSAALEIKTPPRYIEYTTRERMLYGKPPEKIQISKPRTDIVWTPETIKLEKGVTEGYLASRRVGAKQTTIYGVSGSQRKIIPSDISLLPKPQQKTFKSIAEKIVGRPVPDSQVPIILSKNYKYSVGELRAKKLFKISDKGLNIPRPGRTLIKSTTGSRSQLIYTTPEFQVFRTQSAVKSKGKSKLVSGVSKVLKPKDISPKDIGYIAKKGVKPKPIQELGISQAQLTDIAEKIIPKQKTLIPKTKPREIISTKPSRSVSEYYGKGTYERTETVGVQRINPIISPVKDNLELLSKESNKFRISLESRSGIKTRLGIKTRELERNTFKEAFNLNQPTAQIESPGIKQDQGQGIRTRLGLKTESKLSPDPEITQVPNIIIEPSPVKLPRPPKFPEIKLSTDYIPKNRPVPRPKQSDFFTPYVKRYGKWMKIGKPTTKEKALSIGVGRLKTTLAASLKIEKGGKPIPFAKESKEFRLGKGKNPLILVQKAPKRLSARGERMEIISTRRRRKLI